MTAAKRPTRLMAQTPSMTWEDHVAVSRKSKLIIAGVAVGALCAVAGVIVGVALFA